MTKPRDVEDFSTARTVVEEVPPADTSEDEDLGEDDAKTAPIDPDTRANP